eukprot:94259-Prymnesium_polylepis.1
MRKASVNTSRIDAADACRAAFSRSIIPKSSWRGAGAPNTSHATPPTIGASARSARSVSSNA